MTVNHVVVVAENSEANPIDVLGHDRDTWTVTTVAQPTHGELAITPDGKGVTYTPNPEYTGEDGFEYTINNGEGETATARVTINVVGSVLFVDAEAVGANDGTAWNDAFTDLQKALEVAANSGGLVTDIWVADGEYRPTKRTDPQDVRSATFRLVNGLAIYGGFAGGEATNDQRDPDANPTVLSGDVDDNDESGPDATSENCYHVVTGSGTDSTAVLDGFRITGGNADGPDSEEMNGAGMYNINGNPTVGSCVFEGNVAADQGGAVYNVDSRPVLADCWFARNDAEGGGGGAMYNSVSDLMLVNCTFSANTAYGGDGGAVLNSVSNPTLLNCVFNANSVGNNEGGIHNFAGSSPTLVNCTFSGNEAGASGGGIYNSEGIPTLANCILWGNTDREGQDESAQIHSAGGTPAVNHSCIRGLTGDLDRIGNIGDEPVSLDLGGNPRIVNGRVDMGTYEFQP